MYNMCWEIIVGQYTLGLIEKVEITRSVELLSDIATIVLPATSYNTVLGEEKKIKRGDIVSISLGYDDVLVKEFNGFVQSISTDGGSFTLHCEDSLYQYRKALPNIELINPTLKDIINYVHKTITGFTVDCDYEWSYEKFVFQNMTGYDVLSKIQKEANPNIYLKGNVLHIHPKYIQIFGTANYDFAINIDSVGTDLKYKLANDRVLLVTVKSQKPDGTDISGQYGKAGGDETTVTIPGVYDVASLTAKAKAMYDTKVFTGYEGSFTSWLIPFCDAGYKATVNDDDFPEKSGDYYISEVKVEFSSAGGKRIIKLTKQLSKNG